MIKIYGNRFELNGESADFIGFLLSYYGITDDGDEFEEIEIFLKSGQVITPRDGSHVFFNEDCVEINAENLYRNVFIPYTSIEYLTLTQVMNGL